MDNENINTSAISGEIAMPTRDRSKSFAIIAQNAKSYKVIYIIVIIMYVIEFSSYMFAIVYADNHNDTFDYKNTPNPNKKIVGSILN